MKLERFVVEINGRVIPLFNNIQTNYYKKYNNETPSKKQITNTLNMSQRKDPGWTMGCMDGCSTSSSKVLMCLGSI